MSKKFTVLWQDKSGRHLLAIDDGMHCDSADEAKGMGRKMLTRVRNDAITPVGMVELRDDEMEGYIKSDRELVEFPDFLSPSEEIPFVALNIGN